MLLTTAESLTVSPASVRTPLTRPSSDRIAATPVPGRRSTPSSPARRSSASGTARVPPMGYHTPFCVCMCAMEHSTAGEA